MRKPRADRALAQAAVAGLRPSGSGWQRGACPYCEADGHHDRKASFGVSPAGYFSCFRCGVKGWIDDRGRDPWFRQADVTTSVAERASTQSPPGFEPIWRTDAWESSAFAAARDYLASRGIDRGRARDAGIGAVLGGKYHHRVVVPVLGLDGAWVGWVGRAWFKKADRPYVYPEGVWRGQSIYNHAALRVETDRPVFVVEGVFDSLYLGDDGAALLGKHSPWQVEALAESPRPIVVALDGDAWREGMGLAMQLRLRGQRAGALVLPPETDPDELPREVLDDAGARSLARTEPVEVVG